MNLPGYQGIDSASLRQILDDHYDLERDNVGPEDMEDGFFPVDHPHLRVRDLYESVMEIADGLAQLAVDDLWTLEADAGDVAVRELEERRDRMEDVLAFCRKKLQRRPTRPQRTFDDVPF